MQRTGTDGDIGAFGEEIDHGIGVDDIERDFRNGVLMSARVLTALAHGTFFGVGSVVATNLVAWDRKASAIAIMFTGLTLANILGVPLGTWMGQQWGWRSTFWAVTAVGILAFAIITTLVPADKTAPEPTDWRADMRAMAQRPVLLGLLTTVLGYAGVFAVFTYIAPILTTISGFSDGAVADPAGVWRRAGGR